MAYSMENSQPYPPFFENCFKQDDDTESIASVDSFTSTEDEYDESEFVAGRIDKNGYLIDDFTVPDEQMEVIENDSNSDE